MRIGQKVVCIKAGEIYGGPGISPTLILGNIYTINATAQFCCSPLVDVGLSTDVVDYNCKCGRQITSGSGIWWVSASRFAPIEEISETTYEDIVKPAQIGA